VTEESDDVLRALADPERLAIAGMLAREPRTAASLREAGLPLGAASEDEEAVLRTFFRNGRLTEIPAKESKRRIVLERVAIEFEPGVRYYEKEVNVIVGRFLNDYAALRRSLVD
jgi:hypothetical protein